MGTQLSAENSTALSLDPVPKMPVELRVNGRQYTVNLSPWTSLLDTLREHLNLTGTKKGCDHGQCGACTVLLDGKRINSCMALAVACDDAAITTIEAYLKAMNCIRCKLHLLSMMHSNAVIVRRDKSAQPLVLSTKAKRKPLMIYRI